ncbi:MAG: hypothetical protein M3R11_12235 [Acidobacteriota bacterium]|nr:hypothetical protein [Acidobacteriota bacterium]
MTNKDKCQFNFIFYRFNFFYPARIFLLGLLLFSPVSISAKTLTEYRENIRGAKVLIVNLLNPDVENLSYQDFQKIERKTVAELRSKLPARETIEWENSSLETGNQWLADKLDKFEKEEPDAPRRWEILTEISERLDALEVKINELENPSAIQRAKDEDKRKLAEILRREEYQKPEEKQPSLFEKIYLWLMEWLAKMFPRPNISPSSTGFESLSFVLQMLLYALILGAIGFLIYRFAPFFANRFRTRERSKKPERVILGERLSADETAQNLFSEAERLAREGNLRGAIRKGYVALLCELSDKKIIGLSQHKTNRDYLKDVRKRNELYINMSGLTNNYERHWYGSEDAEEKDWEEFRNGYRKAVSSQ